MRGKIEQHQAEIARARQRAHQAKYRKNLKKRRAPNRDDLAALALRFVIRIPFQLGKERRSVAALRQGHDRHAPLRVRRSGARIPGHRKGGGPSSGIGKPGGSSKA